ncbi:MAG TPA: hypothetical protein VGC86_11880 [Afipia sp.]
MKWLFSRGSNNSFEFLNSGATDFSLSGYGMLKVKIARLLLPRADGCGDPQEFYLIPDDRKLVQTIAPIGTPLL